MTRDVTTQTNKEQEISNLANANLDNLNAGKLPPAAQLTAEQKYTLDILQILLSSRSQEQTLDDFIDYVYRRFSGTEMVLFAFHSEDSVHVVRSRPELSGQVRDDSFPALSSQALVEFDDLDSHPRWCKHYQAYFPHVASCLQVKICVATRRYVMLLWHEDGRRFTAQQLNRLLFGMESTKLVMAYLVSIEDNYQHEENQYQHDKLASLGKLAAGVAHEINNPLGFIMSNVSTLASYFSEVKTALLASDFPSGIKSNEDERLQGLLRDSDDLLSETMEGLTRIQNIVASLNAYNHSDPINYHLVDLRDVVSPALGMILGDLKLKANIIYELPEAPFYVLGQISKLRQVVIDIVVNALQSIHHNNGEVSIMLAYEENGLSPRKRNILLVIKDNGKGIAEQDLDCVFDPFFTTKQVGSGAGLGLSVSREVIDDHHGTIIIDSQEEVGTQVEIRLPCVVGKV